MTSAPSSNPSSLTLHDFVHSGAARIVADNPGVTLHALGGLFFAASTAAGAGADTTSAAMLMLLGRICSITLQPGNRSEPLTPMAVWSDGTSSLGPDHLQPHELDLLAQLTGQIDHVALRARFADLVWLRAKRHGQAHPLRAIDDYRTVPPDPGSWYEFGWSYWHRALQLAIELKGAAGTRLHDMEEILVDHLEQTQDAPGFYPLHVQRPLSDERLARRHAERVIAVLERRGRAAAEARNALEAAPYLEAAKLWLDRERQVERAAQLQVLLAKAWEAHADDAAEATTRHHFYGDAIRAYRAVSTKYRVALGVDAALQAVRHKYEQAGRDSVGEMVTFQSAEMDLTDLAEATVKRVRKADRVDALIAFCALQGAPSKAAYLKGAEDFFNKSLLMRLMGGATMAEDGRVVARNAGGDAGAAPTPEQVEKRAMLDFANDAGMIGHAMIRPALDQLHLDHVFTVSDFRAIAQRCGIVLAGRADMVGAALYAGFRGDLEHALHVLLPQFEHVVREVLKVAGALTMTHSPDEGVDMEIGLSRLTERPQMVEVFGEDLTFEIRAMMCVEPGPNLRNLIAHGLADSELCQGPHGRYTWWMILRVIVEQFRARWEAAQAEPASGCGTETP